MRIKLIVTGDLEREALDKSLHRMFLNTGCSDNVEFLPPQKIHSITSNRLPQVDCGNIPTTIKKLVSSILAELQSGSEGIKADMSIGIDDLELANLDQPEVVIGWVRQAVEEKINEYPSQRSRDRVRRLFKEKSSFHLLKPMSEAYFYAERAALDRAGVSRDITSHRIGADVEEFETNDPGFLPLAHTENQSHHQAGRAWWHSEKHPKRYLEYLCDQSGYSYSERISGANALRALNWEAAALHPGVALFARALFEDIADFLHLPSPLIPLSQGSVLPPTYQSRSVRRATLVMRNI